MSRLENIKEHLHQLLPTTEYRITDYQEESFKWAAAYQNDVQYLLQRLEIAHKALESVANAPARETMRRYADKALEQLKE